MVRPTQKSRGRRGLSGFTLMEMLIVVAIIAITAALAAPAMHSQIMERKNGEASLDLVRLGREARSSAIAYGRAHVIRFDAGSSGRGRFRLFRGVSSGCNALSNDWATIMSTECGVSGSFCVDWHDLGDSKWTLGSSTIRVQPESGETLLDVCYEPRGMMLHRSSAGARFSSINTIAGGFIFDFERVDSGSVSGVTRRVLVPFGGEARPLQ